MAFVYFDIKKSQFYDNTASPLYPFDFTAVGHTVRTRLEEFIASVEPFHLRTIGDVILFDLTEENKSVIKMSAAPFEVDQDDVDTTVFRIKYGYVAMYPHNVLNSSSVFRSLVYNLSKADKVQSFFNDSDHVKVVGTKAYSQQVLDITYRNQYNTFAAVVGFKIKTQVTN